MIRYCGDRLALVIPTKDRPHKVVLFLESVKKQSVACGKIIIVASGEDIADSIKPYFQELPIEYYHTDLRGQIPQRNFGISKLDNTTPLVASFDDDIELEDGAFENMIRFWNGRTDDVAGVAFNIINGQLHEGNRLLEFFKLSSKHPGRVFKSGRTTPVTAVEKDIKTEWLCGGATVWKLEILNKYKVDKDIRSRWAPNEDLIFSYPVGKEFDLYVCADAKVRHEHVRDHTKKAKDFFYSRVSTMWRIFFISSYRELSLCYYFAESFLYILARILMGVTSLSRKHIDFGCGRVAGIIMCILPLLGRKSWKETLSN